MERTTWPVERSVADTVVPTTCSHRGQLRAMRQPTVTMRDDAPQARTTIVDTRLLETPKNCNEQFKFVFLDYTGFVDMRFKPTRSESMTMQESALKSSMIQLLEGSAQRLCLLELVYDGEGLLVRHVVVSRDDPIAVEVDTSLSPEFLTQAAPVDESGSKIRRRGCSEVLSDRVRPAAIQMNPVDDPKRCLIARDDRFTRRTPTTLAQEEVRSIVMVCVALTGLAQTLLRG